VAGTSFSGYSNFNSLINAYYIPSGGHGTKIASLICRVCPHVKLYIARLDEYSAQPLKANIISLHGPQQR